MRARALLPRNPDNYATPLTAEWFKKKNRSFFALIMKMLCTHGASPNTEALKCDARLIADSKWLTPLIIKKGGYP